MDLARLMDPEFQVSQAKFTNAQVAVDKAYQLAARYLVAYSYSVEYKDEKGETHLRYVDRNTDERVAEVIRSARILAKAIQEDLDATLSVLDKKEVKNGNAGKSTTLPKNS
jgi:hypothetical protein